MDFAAVSRTLTTAADLMQANPGLDPDGAVRQAVWGDPNTLYPGDQEPGAETFDYAESAIECWIAARHGYDPGGGIDHLDRSEAIEAARAEAARYASYGGA